MNPPKTILSKIEKRINILSNEIRDLEYYIDLCKDVYEYMMITSKIEDKVNKRNECMRQYNLWINETQIWKKNNNLIVSAYDQENKM